MGDVVAGHVERRPAHVEEPVHPQDQAEALAAAVYVARGEERPADSTPELD